MLAFGCRRDVRFDGGCVDVVEDQLEDVKMCALMQQEDS